jgi:hypothetical protein
MESASNGHLFVKCLICGKPLPGGTLLPVCEEHVKTGEWGEYILDMVEERAASDARASSSIEVATLDWRVHHAEGDWQLLKVPRGRERLNSRAEARARASLPTGARRIPVRARYVISPKRLSWTCGSTCSVSGRLTARFMRSV